MKNDKYLELETKLKKISNLSKKQIQKIIFNLINLNKNDLEILFDLINQAKSEIKKCKICGYYSSDDLCLICTNEMRTNKIIVVEQSDDIDKFEELKIYDGKYYVFSSLYNLKENNDSFNKDFDKLLSLINKDSEVILALKSSMEGILTMQYIKKLITEKYKNINIFQLSMGLPYNASVEYIDPLTLKQSLLNKSKI